MKRKLCSLALALTLALSQAAPALAADVEALFPAVKDYAGYADVAEDAWYAQAAAVCYETGLLTGTGADTFSPQGIMSVAQAATLAARIHDILGGGSGVMESPDGQPWYAGAVAKGAELARAAGDLRLLSRLSHPDDPATRADFFGLLSLVVGEELLSPINAIQALPDTDDPAVLAFYNAGLLTGKDGYGTFRPNGTLERAEAAAMAARLVRPALRKVFTPKELPVLCAAAGVLPETVFFQGEKTVAALDYLTAAAGLIQELERACATEGMEFNWLNTYGGKPFLDYVKEGAMAALGVTKEAGTDAYRAFDLQVFYSRYLDLTGR